MQKERFEPGQSESESDVLNRYTNGLWMHKYSLQKNSHDKISPVVINND